MAQEIKKISVDGVVYDIAATSSEETGSDVQEQLDSLSQKTEELDKKIINEAARTDEMINQVNENTASSIQTLNDNLVSAINTINGGIAAEITNREDGDKALEKKISEETTAREELDSKVSEIQESLESLGNPNEKVEEEKIAREEADSVLSEKIDSSVKTLNETIVTVNENTASSIQTLNDNLVSAINTINGGIDNEIRPELEKAVKWEEDKTGCGERTIELGITDTISSLDAEGEAHNIASVSSTDGKLHIGSATSPMNLNSSERITVNGEEQLAYLSDVATDQDFESLKAQVEENTTKIEETNTTLVGAVGGLNESINTKTEEINNRIDTEVLQKINDLEQEKVGLVETDKNGIKTLNIVLENYASLLGKDTQGAMYNLAMVSKWNKADFGSGSIELNFNGSKPRPTYNDEVELALLTDITGNLDTVQLVKKSDLEYELQVGDRIAGSINIPEDQFFKGSEYNPETHILTLTFKTSDGDQSQDIDLSGLIDVYTAGNGLALEGGSFSVKLDPSTDAYLEVTEAGLKLVGLRNALDTEAEARSIKDTELQGNIEAEAEARIEKDTELEEAISKKVEWANIETEDNPGRKAIVLENHDTIFGKTTEGSANNLIMMSKWNKVDVGTAQNELNLNGSAEHPTYNDTEQFALLKDLEDINEGIEVSIPIRTLKDEVYDKVTILGWFDVEDEIGLKQLIAYKGQMYIKWGISLSTNPHYYRMPIQYAAFESATQIKLVVLGLDTSNDAPVKYEVVINLDGTIVSGNSNIGVTMIDIATKEDIQAAQPDLSLYATKDEVALKADLSEYQTVDVLTYNDDWTSAKTKVEKGVKTIIDSDNFQWTITLVKEEPISGNNTLKIIASRLRGPYSDDINTDHGFSFAQFTLNEGAVAGRWSRVMSNSSFISEYSIDKMIDEKLVEVNGAITLLNDKVALLEGKYNQLVVNNSEVVEDFTGGDTINDSTKSVIVDNAAIETTSTINAKSVVMNNSSLTNNARMKVNADNLEMNNLSVSGEFPKTDGNAVISVNNSDYVVFKDMTFDSSNVYNGVEIGLSSDKLPKNILFDNCKFTGSFSNNAILVFGTQDNATITLNNCYFEKVSNALRLSNKTNASGITVNIINCSVDQWDITTPWQGFLICQDYTSTGIDEIESNNLFGNGKITVNFVNLKYKDEKLVPTNLSKVCGTGNEDQIVYVWAEAKDGMNARPYTEEEYPIITFK